MAELSTYAEHQKQREDQQQRLRLDTANRLQIDADRSDRIWAVAAKTRLPMEVVDSDLDNLEAKLKVEEFNYEDYTAKDLASAEYGEVIRGNQGSPIFNKFAAENPYNFAVMKRDRVHMNRFEKTVNSMWLKARSGWAMGEMGNLVTRELSGNALPDDDKRRKEMRQLLAGGDFNAGPWAKFLTGFSEQAALFAHTTYDSADEMLAGAIAGGVSGAYAGSLNPWAIATVPLGAIAGATTGASAAFAVARGWESFELERGLAYDQYIQLGIDKNEALTMANMVGAINAPLEYIGMGALTKRIPGVKRFMQNHTDKVVSRIFNSPKFTHAAARFTVAYGESVGTEIITEILQETTTMLGQERLKTAAREAGDTRPEMTAQTDAEFWDSLGEIAVETIYAVALMGAGGPVMNFYADSKNSYAAMQQQQQWAALGETAKDSVTRKKAPDAWKEFVSRVQKDGPLKEIRISVEGWRTYWQSKEIDPDEAAKKLGVDLPSADATDTDLVLPFDVFIDKIAPTEHLGGLMKDLRIREDEMTGREAEQWMADRKEKLKEIKEALGDAYDPSVEERIVDDLVPQLISVGHTPDAAKDIATFHAGNTINLALKGKLDPWDYYKATLHGVFREVPEPLTAAGEDIDMDMDPILDAIRSGNFPKQREIYGDSLIDLIRSSGGIKDDGGEISARDLNKIRPGTVSNEGKSIDAMAELAYEAGYIAEFDESMFLEALDREISGDAVFSKNADVNTGLEEVLGQLERAASFLDEEGIDLNTLSNAQVRKYLEGLKTLEQSDVDSLKEWSDLVMAVTQANEQALSGTTLQPGEVDTLLAKAEASSPRVSGAQDFKDVKLTDRVLYNGKPKTVVYSAQEAYAEAIKERNILKRLAKCLNG